MSWVIYTALALVAALVYHFWSGRNTADFYNLPGPGFKWYTPLLGNLVELEEHRDTLIHPTWLSRAWTGRYRFLFGTERAYTADPGAVNHILQKPDIWVKPTDFKTIMHRVTGDGLVTVEGEQHKRQRRVLNPAFSTGALGDMMPVVWDKAAELAALFRALLADASLEGLAALPPKPEDRVAGARKVDVMKHMNSFSADVMGLTGFGHDFKSLSREGATTDPLASNFARLVDACAEDALMTEAQNQFPLLDLIPTRTRRIIAESKRSVDAISARFVARKREEAATDVAAGKDILSRLLAANTQANGLSNDEVRDQIATMLFAGSSTASVALSAAMHRLAYNPRVQAKLRAEVQELAENPDYAALDSLPYLDAVVREILRLDSPVSCTVREAAQDTVITLDKPVKGRDGRVMESIAVKKGTYVLLSFSAMHTSSELWGEDAADFKPERFEEEGWPRMPIPGIVKNTCTFSTGPHHCIGYRLALCEVKVVLFTLLREFSFEPLPSNPKIEWTMMMTLRPEIKGESGAQMPLLVRPLQA